MVPAPTKSTAYEPRSLFRPLLAWSRQNHGLTCELAGSFKSEGLYYALPRFRFQGPPAAHDPIRLGLFAGLHGDEPAGCTALVELLAALVAEPHQARGYDLYVYPACNPTGLEDGTRGNRAGKDLNREFWLGSTQPEVRILEEELATRRFDGLVTLHEDDTCEGIYGYAHGRVINEALLKPALLAAERMLPRDARCTIDGFAASAGVLCQCFKGVLAACPAQKPQPFDIIFETPGRAPFDAQVKASVAALGSILAEYRAFIAYGANL